MRIYFIIMEDYIFHPLYVHRLAQQLGKHIVGLSIVHRDSRTPNLFRDLRELFIIFGLRGFLLLAFQRILFIFADLVLTTLQKPSTFSLTSVARLHHIPSLVIENINSQDHLAYLRSLKLDVILSSNGQIFKKDLLALPCIACINRHSALLPKYGGVWPVLRALQHDEKIVGVTVHTMSEVIDEGRVLAQMSLPIQPNDTIYNLYAKLFRLSVDVTVKAIGNLLRKNSGRPMDRTERLYFSYPTPKEAGEIRKKIQIVKLTELFSRE